MRVDRKESVFDDKVTDAEIIDRLQTYDSLHSVPSASQRYGDDINQLNA